MVYIKKDIRNYQIAVFAVSIKHHTLNQCVFYRSYCRCIVQIFTIVFITYKFFTLLKQQILLTYIQPWMWTWDRVYTMIARRIQQYCWNLVEKAMIQRAVEKERQGDIHGWVLHDFSTNRISQTKPQKFQEKDKHQQQFPWSVKCRSHSWKRT